MVYVSFALIHFPEAKSVIVLVFGETLDTLVAKIDLGMSLYKQEI